jgi:biopolymer transport protein ExbB
MLSFFLQISSAAVNTVAETIEPAVSGIQTAAEPIQHEISLFEMVAKGGVIMLPLALMLLFAIYVMVERLLVIAKAGKKNPTLMPSIKEMLKNGNLANARALCKNVNTPESLMLEQGISRIGQSTQEIREAMDKAGSAQLSALEKNLSVLNITGRIAPMFGFIGTIIGVIKIFYDISVAKTVEIEVISSGLYQKMITSCGGLVVGVIAFVGYHWLNARIDKVALRMEEAQIEFLDALNEPSN